MGRSSDLTAFEKARILSLNEEGKSLRQISVAVGRSVCAIQNTIKKYKIERKFLCVREKKEHKDTKKLSARDEKYLFLLSKRNRRKTVPALTDELNVTRDNPVSKSTVRRSLLSFGMDGRVACKKPLLRRANVLKRLNFAREHVTWTEEQWAKVLFTDETKIEIFGSHRRVFVRRMEGERYLNSCLIPTVKYGGGSVMVWCGVCVNGALPLHRIDGIMKKETYHQILIRKVR